MCPHDKLELMRKAGFPNVLHGTWVSVWCELCHKMVSFQHPTVVDIVAARIEAGREERNRKDREAIEDAMYSPHQEPADHG